MPAAPNLGRPSRYLASGLFVATVAGLAAGALLHAIGLAGADDDSWLTVGVTGLAYAVWAMVDSLRRHRVCTTLLMDKTGTLTRGHPELTAILSSGTQDATQALGLAASLDQASGHVLAGAVVRAAKARGCALVTPEHTREVAGQGISGTVADHQVAVGKAAFCGMGRPADMPGWAKVARRRAKLDGALTVFVSVDNEPAAVLILDDPVRPDAGRTIRALRAGGIQRLVMVTGDRAEVAETVGAVIGVDEVLSERTPAEKLAAVALERRRQPVIMVGDGINDAPALALADVGVAMGARGATGSAQAADAVLTVDRLDRLGEVVALARRTRRIALQSVLAGMGMSLATMGAASAGLLPAVWGAILQEAIDVAVILNALRVLRAGTGAVMLAPELASLSRRFQAEHKAIRTYAEQIRSAADCLGIVDYAEAMARIRELHRMLVSDVEPHEQAEERELYPRLDQALGWPGATATMSRGHAEITHQIRRFGQQSATANPTTRIPPTCGHCCTDCTRCSNCTPRRKTRATYRSPTTIKTRKARSAPYATPCRGPMVPRETNVRPCRDLPAGQ